MRSAPTRQSKLSAAPAATRVACSNPLCAASLARGEVGTIEISQDGATWHLCGLYCALAYLRLCAARHEARDRRRSEAGL